MSDLFRILIERDHNGRYFVGVPEHSDDRGSFDLSASLSCNCNSSHWEDACDKKKAEILCKIGQDVWTRIRKSLPKSEDVVSRIRSQLDGGLRNQDIDAMRIAFAMPHDFGWDIPFELSHFGDQFSDEFPPSCTLEKVLPPCTQPNCHAFSVS